MYSCAFNKIYSNINNSIFTFNSEDVIGIRSNGIALLVIGTKGGGIVNEPRYYMLMLYNSGIISCHYIGGYGDLTDLEITWTPNTSLAVKCPTLSVNSNGRAILIFL